MKKTIKIFACVAMVVTLLLTLAVPCFADPVHDEFPVEFSLKGYSRESFERFHENGVAVSLDGVFLGSNNIYAHVNSDLFNSGAYHDFESKLTLTPLEDSFGVKVIQAAFSHSSYYLNDSGRKSDTNLFYFGSDGIEYMYTQMDAQGNYGYVPVYGDYEQPFFRCDTPETAEKLRALLNPTKMSDLVTNIFESFGIVIGGLTEGLKDSFDELIYVDPAAADLQFSPLILFLFTLAGVAVATGIVYGIFSLVKSKRRG